MATDPENHLQQELADELWREGLRSGLRQGLVVASGSMAPTIREGDRVVVQRMSEPARPRLGDIVLFDFDGRWMVHRIIGCQSHDGHRFYRQKGDAGVHSVLSPEEAIAARVVAIERDGRVFDLMSGRGRLTGLAMGGFFHAADRIARLSARDHGDAAEDFQEQMPARKRRYSAFMAVTAVLANVAAALTRSSSGR